MEDQMNMSLMHDADNFTGIMKALECPVCYECLQIPVFMCTVGHSVCTKCKVKSKSTSCPVCRAEVTSQRNFSIEDVIKSMFESLSANCGTSKPRNREERLIRLNNMERIIKEFLIKIKDLQNEAEEEKVELGGLINDMEKKINMKEDDLKVALDNIEIEKKRCNTALMNYNIVRIEKDKVEEDNKKLREDAEKMKNNMKRMLEM